MRVTYGILKQAVCSAAKPKAMIVEPADLTAPGPPLPVQIVALPVVAVSEPIGAVALPDTAVAPPN